MNYIVYKTTNKINGKMYIGVHHTKNVNIFDGYLGCGCYANKPSTWKTIDNSIFPLAIKKYGPDNFHREILFIFPSTNEGRINAYLKEKELVTQEWVDSDKTYNIALGGISSLTDNQYKKIRQYTLSGEYIKTWDSIQSAESYYNVKGQISKVCRKIHKSSCNFQWRFDADNISQLEDITDIVNQKKSVYQFDLSGNLLKIWKSVSEAATQFDNISSGKSSIKKVCEGKAPQSLGYYWSYNNKFRYNSNNKYMPLASYKPDGTFVKSYSNSMEAMNDLHLSDASGIFASIIGTHKLCKNLRWRYYYGYKVNIKPLKKLDEDIV